MHHLHEVAPHWAGCEVAEVKLGILTTSPRRWHVRCVTVMGGVCPGLGDTQLPCRPHQAEAPQYVALLQLECAQAKVNPSIHEGINMWVTHARWQPPGDV